MALQIGKLFNNSRLQDSPLILFILLLLYFPIGIVLMVIRILVSFQYLIILAILPKGFLVRQFMLRMYLLLIGIPVTTDGLHHKKGNPNVVVSNYISYLDSIVIESVFPTQRLAKQINLPGLFKWLFGFIEDDTSCMGLEALDYEYPISFFPEEDTTNGKYGLLKFGKYLFKKSGLNVQPVVVFSYRPSIFPANVHCLTSTFWSDLFWTLFFPFTKFHVSFLPAREIPNEDGIEAFVKQLEIDIASVLSISPSLFTMKDKSDYIKRLAQDKLMRDQTLPKLRNNHKDISNKSSQMVKQVKAVLPQVPMSNIEVEIKRTKNVDMAISHFLDGTIKYKALTEEEQQSEKEKIINKKKETSIRNSNILPVTATTATGHHLSFQEKKDLMIAEARARYLKLHPEYA